MRLPRGVERGLARRAAAVALSSLPVLLFARPALAHGFEERYDLPVPL